MEDRKRSDAAKSASTLSKGVFVREATGLVKSVSLLDSIAINISYMSIGAALALIGFTMVLLPTVDGVNLVYGSAIAALLAVPQMVVYTIMQRHVSRTGGDYVWLSRSLGGFTGSTLTFMGITLETMPYLALIALSAVFAIGSVAATLGNASLGKLAVGGAGGSIPIYQFVLASSIFALLVLLNVFRPRGGFRIISLFWAIGIISIVVSIVTLLVAGRTGVENYVNSLGIVNTTYSSIANSYTGSAFNFGNTLLIMPFFALFSYPWFNAAPSVGSELKAGKTIRWSTPLSLLVAFLLLTIPFAVMYYVGGFGFTNAALSNANLVNNYSFNFWTLAMGVSGNFVIQFVIGLGWILFTVAVLAFGIITISRYLLAQAFDRFLPERLAYVSPKYGSPIVAHVIDLVITVALIGLASFLYGTFYSLYGVLVAAMIYFAFVGLAAVIYAWKQLGQNGREKAALAVAGVLQIFVFSYLTYEFIAYGSIWGGNLLAYGYVVASFVAGAVIYVVSKSRQKARGIDISYAFREIPPE
jgi:amino acid transporter